MVLLFLAVLPAALIIRLISEYGVNVPFGDEWSMIPLFAKWNDHQLTFADLFQQHNEHRIVIPKLLYIAFAQLTHWNLRAEMFFSVCLCAITSACIYHLLRQTVEGGSYRRLTIWGFTNLLIFSPSQAENWTWGFQLAMFIPTVCLVAVLLLLQAPNLNTARFCGACLLAFAATFSFGSGLLLWPIVGGYFFLRAADKRWIWSWIAAFLLTASLYFARYKFLPPANVPAGPVEYIVYFLRFNGNALGQWPIPFSLVVTAIIGAGAVVLFAALAAFFVKWRGPALHQAAPWMALAAYAVGSALLTTRVRVHESTLQALDSRYSSVSINLFLGVMVLLITASDFRHRLELGRAFSRIVASLPAAFMTVLLLWYVATLPGIVARMGRHYQSRVHGLAALGFCEVIPPSSDMCHQLRVNPELPEFRQNIAVIDRLDLLKPLLRHSNLLRDAANQPNRLTAEFGRSEAAISRTSTTIEMSGWAFLPVLDEPPPCVVLAYETGGRWFGFALAEVKEELPGMTQTMGDQYRRSGWSALIDASSLPKEAREISAWAFDALNSDVFRLPGAIRLPAR